MQRGRAHPANHQERNDQIRLGRHPDQAEQRREHHADHAEQPRAEFFHERTEDRLRYRRGKPVPEDLVILLMANAGVVTATGDAAPDAWRRLVAYMVEAFAAEPARPLPPPPTPAAVYRALLRLHQDEEAR